MPCICPVRLKNPLFNNKDPAAIARRENKTKGSAQFIIDSVKGFSPYIDVPCGKCYGCMRMRCNGWVFRHLCELACASSAHFITLTYNDENLPFTDSLLPCFDKSHVQKFFKRLRKWLSVHYASCKIKYHLASEYGDTFGRPHYHCLLYGFPDEAVALDQIPISWGLGTVDIGSVTEASIRYVVEYITQFYYEESWETPSRVPFAMFSNGLGHSYSSVVADFVSHSLKPIFPFGSKNFKVPNSFLEHLRDASFISNAVFYRIKLNSQLFYENNRVLRPSSVVYDGPSSFAVEVAETKQRIKSHKRKYQLRKKGIRQ